MSCEHGVTSRLAKDLIDEIGQFLNAPQRAERKALDVFRALDPLADNLPLHVGPDTFARVRLRRVRQQIKLLQLEVEAVHAALHPFRFVNWIADDEKRRLGLAHVRPRLPAVAVKDALKVAYGGHDGCWVHGSVVVVGIGARGGRATPDVRA